LDVSNKSLVIIIKELQNRVAALETAPKPSTPDVAPSDVEGRVKALENQYRMLNARLSRKTINGEDTDQRRDRSKA
jgi:uncharacterized protein YceH (UPF0502 family)